MAIEVDGEAVGEAELGEGRGMEGGWDGDGENVEAIEGTSNGGENDRSRQGRHSKAFWLLKGALSFLLSEVCIIYIDIYIMGKVLLLHITKMFGLVDNFL